MECWMYVTLVPPVHQSCSTVKKQCALSGHRCLGATGLVNRQLGSWLILKDAWSRRDQARYVNHEPSCCGTSVLVPILLQC